MVVHTVYVTTDNDTATTEELANALHSAVRMYLAATGEATFTELDNIVSVDAERYEV